MSRAGPFKRLFLLRARKGWVEDSVELEIQHHLEMRMDELAEEGLKPEEARRVAEEAFGDMGRYRSECVALQRREERMTRWMEFLVSIMSDGRIALRTLRKQPVFTVTVLLTLGLGLGASTAIFTVVDAVLIRPAPFPDADRLVEISPLSEESGFALPFLTKDAALAWRDEAEFVEEIGFSTRMTMVRTDGERAIRMSTYRISPVLMQMLDVPPLLGRPFTQDDGDLGAPEVVILSERVWMRDFGGARDVLGRSITLDDRPHTVVGVMPRTFRYPNPGTRDQWVALNADHLAAMDARGRLNAVARLPLGASIASITEPANALQAGLADEGVGLPGFAAVRLTTLGEWRANPDTERALWVLSVAVAIVMLIAGLNAANLMLVRGSARAREIGVRLALGGPGGRVVRQVATEGIVISLAAGTLATLVAVGTLGMILAIAPLEVTEWSKNPIELDSRVLAFTFLLSALVGCFFAVLPAVSSVRSAIAMGHSRLGSFGGNRQRLSRWRDAVVIAEVGLSVVLLSGAGLFLKNFQALIETDLGFEVDGLVQLRPGLMPARYPDADERRAFFDELVERVSSLPGVVRVSLVDGMPPGSGFVFGDSLMGEGGRPPIGQPDVIPIAGADETFLETLGVELVAGRNFSPDDLPEDRARIVDLEMARFLFGEDAPIGKRFRMGEDGEWMTIVGVVRDLHLMGPNDTGARYEMLRPLAPENAGAYWSLAIRTRGDSGELFAPIRSIIRDMDPGQPIDRLEAVSGTLLESLESERFVLKLMLAFAAVALTLSALGIFGLVSHIVQRQFREIGIRVALGADGARIRAMVLRRGLYLSITGALLGLLGALALGRFTSQLLHDIEPTDPSVLAVALTVSMLTCLVASVIPVRQALSVDLIEVLRAE